MRLKKKLAKRCHKWVFGQLASKVRAHKLRPFRVDDDGVWFETEHGFAVFCNFEDRILELDVNPVWEPMETRFVLDNVHEGDVFLDVGANIGYFSMLAAQRQPSKVLAFEPVPRTFELLTRNVGYNKLEGVIEPVNMALGSRVHTAMSVSGLGPKNHIESAVDSRSKDLPKVEVQVTTLDALLAERPSVGKVDFIKVDIEGYESQFLQGARQTIASFRPLMLMEVEQHRLSKFGAKASDIFDFMKELGYFYLCVRSDKIVPAASYDKDLTEGRDFVFFTSDHDLVY